MQKKAVIAISSISVLAVAGSLAIGGVYALFQDRSTLKYHIQSGSLNVTPYLCERYVKNYENPSGKITPITPNVDLSQDGSALFSLGGESSPIYPGLEEGAGLLVKPAKGTTLGMAIDLSASLASIKGYSLENGNWVETATCPLLSQIQVSIATGSLAEETKVTSFLLSEAPSTAYAVGSYAADEVFAASFTIRYRFLNLEATSNNLAQSERFSFDFVIDAVQQTL
jgi:hypothetical protein